MCIFNAILHSLRKAKPADSDNKPKPTGGGKSE